LALKVSFSHLPKHTEKFVAFHRDELSIHINLYQYSNLKGKLKPTISFSGDGMIKNPTGIKTDFTKQ
jgi:hypothetical protein